MEAVDEVSSCFACSCLSLRVKVVQRLSGDNGESLGKRLSLENQSGDQPNQELSVVQSSQDPRTSLPAADIERSFSLDAADLETVVSMAHMSECVALTENVLPRSTESLLIWKNASGGDHPWRS